MPHDGAVTSWFGSIDFRETSEAQRRVIGELDDLLAQLRPARLDRAQTVAKREDGETWVKLAHDSEPWMEIRFVLSDGWVNFYGVMGHDEAYSPRPEPQDGWESDTIDIVADLLQSTFKTETYTLRGRPWREVLTISAPYDRTSTELKSLTSALPLSRWARHEESRIASFECHGSRRPAS